MSGIDKCKETMTARERVLKTFNLEKTDRVTIGYEGNQNINQRLIRKLNAKDYEEMLDLLGVDYRGVMPPYKGPFLFKQLLDRRTDPVDGYNMRWVEHQTGGYWDFCDFPLKDAADEEIEAFPIPDPDDFDIRSACDYIQSLHGRYAIYIGHAGVPDVLNSNGRIMGMEDVLVHLALENEAAIGFFNRRADMYLKVMDRTLDQCRGMIDFMWLGEDLGTQIAPMISLELYRQTVKPIHKKFVDLAKAYNIPVIMHTCGSSSWAYEDLVEIGIRGVDTLQPEAVNMSPEYLKEKFGGRLCFRGCISTAGPLAYGTAGETREYCRRTLEVMMKGYGYHFAPTHCIQDNSPVENVVAMYQAAHDFGVYRY